MNMHRLFLILTMVAASLLGQADTKIAPEREAELKSRVSKFWDGFVAGKYRASDAFVSDESKEDFFSWPKKKIKAYTIDRVEYAEGGKHAKVLTFVDTNLMMMGVGSMDIKQPVETWWREEDGVWFWFVPKNQIRDTPFGKMESNPTSGEAPLSAPNTAYVKPDLNQLRSAVKPDREEIRFVLGEASSASVTFSNSLPGEVTLTIDVPPNEDLAFDLSSRTIPRAGSATLKVTYKATFKPLDPMEKILKVVRVGVAQTGKMYPIRVLIEPKEIK